MQVTSGKYYLTRKGEVALLSHQPLNIDGGKYPYVADTGQTYTSSGRADVDDNNHPDDLVAEGVSITPGFDGSNAYVMFMFEDEAATPVHAKVEAGFKDSHENVAAHFARMHEQAYAAATAPAGPFGVEGYELLADVLVRAYEQASGGKGKERHAGEGIAFQDQPMTVINDMLGSIDGFLFQAHKKSLESKRLPLGRAQAELLGAINYLAGAVIALDHKQAMENNNAV